MISLKKNYQNRAAQFHKQADDLHKKYNQYSIVRLLVFVAGLAAIVWFWSFGILYAFLFIPLFIFGFYLFMRWHLEIARSEKHNRQLARVNEDELAALDYRYQDVFPSGKEFIAPEHPYSYDLDIVGPYSLFQLINRCGTAIGQARLADYLLQIATPTVITQRQAAIKELAAALEWRQELRTHGLETADKKEHLQLLYNWLDEPAELYGKTYIRIFLWLVPLLTISALAYCIYMLYPWYVTLLSILPAVLLLRRHLEAVNTIHRQTAKAEEMLAQYGRLLAQLETQQWQSELLKTQRQRLGASAARDVRALSYIISQLNVRYNAFAVILNILGLWDLQWVYRLERWKATHRDQLPAWFDTLAEMEAISSLATLHYNHPDWVFPQLSEDKQLIAQELGHPLLHPEKRICNDLSMPTHGHIKLITGSNMAGKSTLLRTVGLNIVLAMAGAPVCARALRLPLLKVYSSMRTQDALHESTSSFYAELKRLKFIIEAVEKGDNIFFLLDEILKGTNSNDRHTGSRALIRQLIRDGGSGLIATHDLELGVLEAQYAGAIENLCMEVEIKDNQLFFDYKIKKGVSKSFNATLLMQNMGIRIRDDESL